MKPEHAGEAKNSVDSPTGLPMAKKTQLKVAVGIRSGHSNGSKVPPTCQKPEKTG